MTGPGTNAKHGGSGAVPPKQSSPGVRAKAHPTPLPHNQDDGRTQSLYRELLQGLYDAVLVSDPRGNIMDSNRRAQEFLGYTDAELQHMNVSHVISGLDDRVLDKVRRHLADGRFTVLDASCVRKDGTTFPAEIAMSRIRLTSAGNLVFSMRNIEHRRRTQERLRTEHNAIQSSASSIAIADLSARLQYVNPAFLKLWGYGGDADVLGQDIRQFWLDCEEANRHLVETPLAARAWSGELTALGRNGREFHVQASAAPNRDSSERLIGVVFSFVDITDRRRAEDAIRREAEAQMRKARDQEEFAGLLNILSIPDVVQLIHTTAKSGTLVVRDAGEQTVSELSFAKGQIVRIECGERSGEDAMQEVLRCRGTAFYFQQGSPQTQDASISKSTMTLLLEATQAVDEKT